MNRPKQIALALAFLFVSGCAPKQPEIATYVYDSPTVTALSAAAHAKDVGGYVTNILPTGSMEPTLKGGDMVVVSSPALDPFENIKKGDAVRYAAPGSPHFAADVGAIMHRAVLRDSLGWVMSGDHNAHSESKWRLTRENYLGRAVAVYRTRSL
jgi:hypothetical protein